MHLLSKGNRKLPSSIGIFNLPQGSTCPGATEECKKYCYTIKAERMYKAVRPARIRNYEASLRPTFTAEMLAEIKDRNIRIIRIHESGDFYNQAYVDNWIMIAQLCPDRTFFAYTKSFHLFDFSYAPKNFILRASIDPSTPLTSLDKCGIILRATVIEKDAPAPDEYFVCPGSCKTCSYCYTEGNRNVAFRKH